MHVGITGHQEVENQEWVKAQLIEELKNLNSSLVGISSLAVGADQFFAESVLRMNGQLMAIVPFEGYEKEFEGTGRSNFTRLLEAATAIETLPMLTTKEESYLAAGKRVVDLSNLLIAIWNGKPAKGLGGTADIVQYAQEQSCKLIHINPLARSVTRF